MCQEVALLSDLHEDFETSWVPDVLARIDFEAMALSAENVVLRQGITPLDVPRPGGDTMRVFALPFQLHAQLHAAVSPLASSADDALLPGVFGYRRGAESGATYRDEHRRFVEATKGLIESHAFVVFADVARFFPSLGTRTVANSIEQLTGSTAPPELLDCLHHLNAHGVPGLPSGYADARLLANIVLSEIDSTLNASFTRWVDDYRVFVQSEAEASGVIERLHRYLGSKGLALNEAKLKVIPAAEARRELGRSLESVYHPEQDPTEKSRADLLALLADISGNLAEHRRELRFLLRRMAQLRDAALVSFALRAIRVLPWEAPRLVAYLGSVELSVDQGDELIRVFADATVRESDWLVARLAPLAARTRVPEDVRRALVTYLSKAEFRAPAIWGLGLRVLSASADHERVMAILSNGTLPDPRAVLAACKDLGLDLNPAALEGAPATGGALASLDAPLPDYQSIL
jgi:hypothetical protein